MKIAYIRTAATSSNLTRYVDDDVDEYTSWPFVTTDYVTRLGDMSVCSGDFNNKIVYVFSSTSVTHDP